MPAIQLCNYLPRDLWLKVQQFQNKQTYIKPKRVFSNDIQTPNFSYTCVTPD